MIRAIRLSFLLAGVAMSCWAPLVPIVKTKFLLSEDMLGLLLLCLGCGSLIVMSSSSFLIAKFGSRLVTLIGAFGLAMSFPLILIVPSAIVLGLLLFVFGAFLGALEVAMNINAIEVERMVNKTLMSGFHGMFSVGGFLGAGFMTLLFSIGLSPVMSSVAAGVVMIMIVVFAMPGISNSQHSDDTPHFMMPSGIVLILSVLAAVIFMVEGAMLDWGALLMLAKGNIDIEHSGIAYMLFAIAMTIGRFYGDRLTTKIGDFNTVLWGGLIVLMGLVLIVVSNYTPTALLGFFLVGCGASNIVPVLFRQAGKQKIMPMALAVASISTLGYTGILVGPALIGFIAEATSLHMSFVFMALLWTLVPLLSRRATHS